jgi:peptidoglycan/xylan/chitin deacetylase (PgdA/CDA1 family)
MTNSNLLIKRSIKSAASMLPFGVGFPRATPGSINILAYHRVVEDIRKAEREAIYGIVISADTFRRHCEMLKKTFDVVSLNTAAHFLESRRQVARPAAVITFDDGYVDSYEVAFPILNELGLPATVFVPTAHIGTDKPLAHDRIYWLLKNGLRNSGAIKKAIRNVGVTKIRDEQIHPANLLGLTDELVYLPHELRESLIAELESSVGSDATEYPAEYRLMNWEMVQEMDRKGVSIGSHTANHVVLPLEDKETVYSELADSRSDLERHLGRRNFSFAYPNGEYSANVKNAVAAAGYSIAVTTQTTVNMPGVDRLELGRTSLCEESTRGISGSYSAAVASLRLGATG